MPPTNFLSRLFARLNSRNQPKTVPLEISENYSVEIPAHYPDELLDTLRSLVGVEGKESLLFDAINLVTASKAPAEAVFEYLTYRKYIASRPWVAGQLTAAIHWYPQLPPMDDYSKAEPLLHSQIAGLLIAADALYFEDQKRTDKDTLPLTDGDTLNYYGCPIIGITSDELVHLILDHPKRAQDIAGLMIARNTTDAAFVRSLIEVEAPAIGEGSL